MAIPLLWLKIREMPVGSCLWLLGDGCALGVVWGKFMNESEALLDDLHFSPETTSQKNGRESDMNWATLSFIREWNGGKER